MSTHKNVCYLVEHLYIHSIDWLFTDAVAFVCRFKSISVEISEEITKWTFFFINLRE